MLTLDRLKSTKDKSYFSAVVQDPEQSLEGYIRDLEEIGKTSPASLIIAGFEYFLRYLEPKKLLQLLEAIQKLQASNLSRQNLFRISVLLRV
jgi:hypothetical protein